MRISNALLLAILALVPLNLHANLDHAPKNFSTQDGAAVFIDFDDAQYNLSYDQVSKKVEAKSVINFETAFEGMPLYDLVESPTSIILDGELVQDKLINSPDNDTSLRMILKTIKPGKHTVIIHSPIKMGVNFLSDGVSSAFWYSDLDDRSYLEAYLPSNYEFDQYQMTFNIDFLTMQKQRIYTNGLVSKIDDTKFKVEFPSTFTSSSAYFHTAPQGRYAEKLFNFRSIDGRDIPVVAYSSRSISSLEALKTNIIKSLNALESQYGAFLHPTLTVFNAGSGGMEYCGATMTDTWALNHELTHSYFARGGLMPANGNAGWLDEAITSWSDDGSPIKTDLGNMRSNMAGHSEYRRYTDMDAYSKGKSFIAHLHYKYQANGGVTSFLNQLIQTDAWKPMTTEEFIKKISTYYSEDLSPLFQKHIYSKGAVTKPSKRPTRPVHMKMSIQEMAKLL